MPRRDSIHDAVKNALINDGWHISDDPLFVDVDGGVRTLEIDLGGEKTILATKGTQEIAVEIKSFSSGSVLNASIQCLVNIWIIKRLCEKQR